MLNIFCANIFAHLVQPHIVPDTYHRRSALDSNVTYNLKAVKENIFFFLFFSASRRGMGRKRLIILKRGELVFTDSSCVSAFAYQHPERHCLECHS